MSALLDEYLTREELARELRVNPRTIIRYENQPDGLPRTTLGKRVLYHRHSVLAWIREHERKPNPRRGGRAR